jgi:transcriptional regulator of met regulon
MYNHPIIEQWTLYMTPHDSSAEELHVSAVMNCRRRERSMAEYRHAGTAETAAYGFLPAMLKNPLPEKSDTCLNRLKHIFNRFHNYENMQNFIIYPEPECMACRMR